MQLRAMFLSGVVLCALGAVGGIAGKVQETNQAAKASSQRREPVEIPVEEVAGHWTGTHKAVRLRNRGSSPVSS